METYPQISLWLSIAFVLGGFAVLAWSANAFVDGASALAKAFGVSKSTVHFDVTKRLVGADGELAEKVKKVLFVNLSERHIRGGVATRNKFRKIRS